ncbi:MAG: hypothetical protein KKH52_04385 [Nanoarchaeota archaeon]|nr:hypothetical protein [Nanoarchaeota archaeon]MBU1622742.1 hypothetical protein [Nanoarchaeota archaeon]MBU1974606.1 hypothetical protein [Nanoarchaeota archaeon]
MENNQKILEEGYQKAIVVIKACSTKHGLYASAGVDGYNAVWARDSMISLIGASVVENKIIKPAFKTTFQQSLITLGKHQSKHGQIPNAVDKWSKRKPHVDYASIDSSLWYFIGHQIYKKRYNDSSLFKKQKKYIEKTLQWLDCQDGGEDETLLQLPTTDWQDAFPHKYGRTINTQALYYHVLQLAGRKKDAQKLKNVIEQQQDKKLWNGNYYSAWRWKNHGKFKERGEWFDTLGNLLAIVFGLADQAKAKKIIAYIERKKINLPVPVKAIYPPIKKNTKEWQDYFADCDAREPNHYLNGGIWTFIGGFYVLSLIKLKKFTKAKVELVKIAQANLAGNFPEWIDPVTKEAFGKLQAWDAGMYLLAYQSLKKKKVLL